MKHIGEYLNQRYKKRKRNEEGTVYIGEPNKKKAKTSNQETQREEQLSVRKLYKPLLNDIISSHTGISFEEVLRIAVEQKKLVTYNDDTLGLSHEINAFKDLINEGVDSGLFIKKRIGNENKYFVNKDTENAKGSIEKEIKEKNIEKENKQKPTDKTLENETKEKEKKIQENKQEKTKQENTKQEKTQNNQQNQNFERKKKPKHKKMILSPEQIVAKSDIPLGGAQVPDKTVKLKVWNSFVDCYIISRIPTTNKRLINLVIFRNLGRPHSIVEYPSLLNDTALYSKDGKTVDFYFIGKIQSPTNTKNTWTISSSYLGRSHQFKIGLRIKKDPLERVNYQSFEVEKDKFLFKIEMDNPSTEIHTSLPEW